MEDSKELIKKQHYIIVFKLYDIHVILRRFHFFIFIKDPIVFEILETGGYSPELGSVVFTLGLGVRGVLLTVGLRVHTLVLGVYVCVLGLWEYSWSQDESTHFSFRSMGMCVRYVVGTPDPRTESTQFSFRCMCMCVREVGYSWTFLGLSLGIPRTEITHFSLGVCVCVSGMWWVLLILGLRVPTLILGVCVCALGLWEYC